MACVTSHVTEVLAYFTQLQLEIKHVYVNLDLKKTRSCKLLSARS